MLFNEYLNDFSYYCSNSNLSGDLIKGVASVEENGRCRYIKLTGTSRTYRLKKMSEITAKKQGSDYKLTVE